MKLYKFSLKHGDTFFRIQEAPGQYVFGCRQEWYQTDWQRGAGCGPTVASNLLSYLAHSGSAAPSGAAKTSRDCLLEMEEAWRYVTPGEEGIPTTGMLCEGFLNYAKAKGIFVSAHSLDIPQNPSMRPTFQELLDFIAAAMQKDSPAAFLNLCNGDVDNLDRWHWVTVLSLEYQKDGSAAMLLIMDEGRIMAVDLKLWYETTLRGGGFAFFEKDEKRAEKKTLRESILAKERQLSTDDKKNQDRQIYQRLVQLDEYKSADTIFCFVGTEHEMDTRPFILAALSSGKCVAVPLCTGKGKMEARKISSLSDLAPGFHGLSEPGNHCPMIEPDSIDFAVIPCISCDRAGYRIGQGGGYYDRYLPKLRCPCAVVCRESFMSDAVPQEAHDIAVQIIVTDKKIIRPGEDIPK